MFTSLLIRVFWTDLSSFNIFESGNRNFSTKSSTDCWVLSQPGKTFGPRTIRNLIKPGKSNLSDVWLLFGVFEPNRELVSLIV